MEQDAIEIIVRSLIHYQTNNSSFFYPLPSLKFRGELSDIPNKTPARILQANKLVQ